VKRAEPKKIQKPRPFYMPESGVLVAICEKETDPWFQLHSSGSFEAKTARRLSAWLLQASLWMKQERARPSKRRGEKDE